MIATRWSGPDDAAALSRIHAAAWRFAYAGLVPGLALERRIAAHGARWWRGLHAAGGRALVVELDGAVAGYARLGPCRWRGLRQGGEIYELYLDPVCHGAGLGRRLFADAREQLAARGFTGLAVWSLAGNALGNRFYRALGGRRAGHGRTMLGGVAVEQVAYVWA